MVIALGTLVASILVDIEQGRGNGKRRSPGGVPFDWMAGTEQLKHDLVVAEQVEAVDTIYNNFGLPASSGVIDCRLSECLRSARGTDATGANKGEGKTESPASGEPHGILTGRCSESCNQSMEGTGTATMRLKCCLPLFQE